MDLTTPTALWWAVVFSGLYHGINPGMGWPLAVSAGLMQGRRSGLLIALGLLALGHLLAMLAILLPFSFLTVLFVWEKELRMGAGILVLLMGIYLLINRKHPKFLARVHPANSHSGLFWPRWRMVQDSCWCRFIWVFVAVMRWILVIWRPSN